MNNRKVLDPINGDWVLPGTLKKRNHDRKLVDDPDNPDQQIKQGTLDSRKRIIKKIADPNNQGKLIHPSELYRKDNKNFVNDPDHPGKQVRESVLARRLRKRKLVNDPDNSGKQVTMGALNARKCEQREKREHVEDPKTGETTTTHALKRKKMTQKASTDLVNDPDNSGQLVRRDSLARRLRKRKLVDDPENLDKQVTMGALNNRKARTKKVENLSMEEIISDNDQSQESEENVENQDEVKLAVSGQAEKEVRGVWPQYPDDMQYEMAPIVVQSSRCEKTQNLSLIQEILEPGTKLALGTFTRDLTSALADEDVHDTLLEHHEVLAQDDQAKIKATAPRAFFPTSGDLSELIQFTKARNNSRYGFAKFTLLYHPELDKNLIVAETKSLGKEDLGVFAGKAYKKGEKVVVYDGNNRWGKKNGKEIQKNCNEYVGIGDYLWQVDCGNGESVVIDSIYEGSIGRFVNDSSAPNVKIQYNKEDDMTYYIAKDNIEFGQEITTSYGKDYFEKGKKIKYIPLQLTTILGLNETEVKRHVEKAHQLIPMTIQFSDDLIIKEGSQKAEADDLTTSIKTSTHQTRGQRGSALRSGPNSFFRIETQKKNFEQSIQHPENKITKRR